VRNAVVDSERRANSLQLIRDTVQNGMASTGGKLVPAYCNTLEVRPSPLQSSAVALSFATCASIGVQVRSAYGEGFGSSMGDISWGHSKHEGLRIISSLSELQIDHDLCRSSR
jgi:hypothetical protein